MNYSLITNRLSLAVETGIESLKLLRIVCRKLDNSLSYFPSDGDY
jgi:hypothetical protein